MRREWGRLRVVEMVDVDVWVLKDVEDEFTVEQGG